MNDSFAELLAMTGVQEVCELRSRIGFMAYHGGSLEEQTDVIASLAAERSGASFYAVLQPADVQWHIPSHQVGPRSSAQLKAFIEHVDIVITIHGFGRRDHFTSLLLGGRNRDLRLATLVQGRRNPTHCRVALLRSSGVTMCFDIAGASCKRCKFALKVTDLLFG